MNSNKLKGTRVSKNLTQKEIAEILRMNVKTYNRKELGMVDFTTSEILSVASTLEMNLSLVNEIFFDNEITNCINGRSA
ncbi:helix-turn-helix transcriptional regulator [Clostridium sp. D2Q-14]|uniref:helix-turn-helix transcriptional regulator n=1 Tax=Anaeromonas gelatinilytica TaxID=2683194 RepID=UPI00193C4926|nr:helix-turn-helix transcriptional regulator [Anaeromonas gelatinilytica]MBS4535177.1 helix-turn-helix transcriptional regulator [Anaeromonas gelatinilytica]